MTASHRLFVGIPIEPQVAWEIHAWATQCFVNEPVRVLTPANLHVTLMFFPSVIPASRERMIELVRKIVWKPIPASTGPTVRLGRNALAIMLDMSSGDLDELDRRMVLCSVTPHDGEEVSPLSQLIKGCERNRWVNCRWNRTRPTGSDAVVVWIGDYRLRCM